MLRQLDVQLDSFLHTADDAGHALGAVALWRACAASGDLYRAPYRGPYCFHCERFYSADELAGGRCPEHQVTLGVVEEENWFFQLSRYASALQHLLQGNSLRVFPDSRPREALAFVAGGISDISASRPRERARGWRIPVPDDPGQVMYVWFDSPGNYVTGLGYPNDWRHGCQVGER